MKDKKRRNIVCISIIFVCFFIMAAIYVIPSMYQNTCKARVYEDLQERISSDVCNANIRVVTKITQKAGNVESFNCGETGCGVIIDYKDGYYYVLTAAHVVDGKNIEYSIVPYGEPTYNMARKESDEYVPVDEFYDKYQKASVEYIYDETDIAVIKFKSDDDEEYPYLQISEKEPKYNDRIVSFGKSDEEGSLINYGRITSKDYKTFEVNDGRNSDKVYYHNAYAIPGYSGSAVLNEKMEIVGINIGGGTDFLGRFRHGAMIPISIIKPVLDGLDY
ncbi:MAG: trypsin-like peptidase domain-containing protein [Mogibacterium sp.]|nr:trypsin-like peptidase domain-containing protein [Mogibacterium sp.]